MERVLRSFFFGSGVFALFLGLSALTLWQMNKTSVIPPFHETTEIAPEEVSVEIHEPSLDETVPHKVNLEVNQGDTLAQLLMQANIPADQTHAAIHALQKHYSPRKLKPGHQIEITVMRPEADAPYKVLQALSVRPELDKEYMVQRSDEGTFQAEAITVELEKQEKQASIEIQSSLYDQLSAQGVPHHVIVELIRVYSHKVDFQRGLQSGDRCDVYYSIYRDPRTGGQRAGELLFANLKLRQGDCAIYKFKPPMGDAEYYDEHGQSVRSGLLRTPIDGARVSSRFSSGRRHPILGFTRAHKGVDFAAPTGTPIMASGSGVVTRIGWVNGYGRYIRVRHNNEYSTAYAHMSRFKDGLKKGSRVKQGEIIGYVGATGLASGPHLHYEVLRHGSQIDPLKVKMMPVTRLSGAALTKFNQWKAEIEAKRTQGL